MIPSFRVWASERMDVLRRSGGHTSVPLDVQNIIRGPSLRATSYSHMYESGRHFRTWRTDHMKKSTSNSGIFLLGQDGDQETILWDHSGYFGGGLWVLHMCCIGGHILQVHHVTPT